MWSQGTMDIYNYFNHPTPRRDCWNSGNNLHFSLYEEIWPPLQWSTWQWAVDQN